MNPTFSDPEPKKRKASRVADRDFPRGAPIFPDHMAAIPATRPAPILPLPLPSSALRNTLPPLFQTFPQPLHIPSSSHPHTGPPSPSSSVSTSTSWSQAGYSTSHTLPAQVPPQRRSLRHLPRSYGVEKGVEGGPYPIHGVKRHIDQVERRLNQNSNPSIRYPTTQPVSKTRTASISMPSTLLPLTTSAPLLAAPPSTLPKKRFVLYLRQQPRAARAGPDGRDRRTIDPPPILQLLIKDFDLKEDGRYLEDRDWVVHAKLIPVEPSGLDTSSIQSFAHSGKEENVTRSLLGTMVSSPLYCSDDPDPENAPKHPTTKPSPPPSPTMRFIQRASTTSRNSGKGQDAHKKLPGAFFIFADLSVRKAGQYRLEFRLMKMEPSVLVQNSAVPTISTIISDIFDVVNAKDFDQVRPSTKLVKGLLDRGAGFPLKLKKGLREGQRRKHRLSFGEDVDDEDHDERDDAGDENHEDAHS